MACATSNLLRQRVVAKPGTCCILRARVLPFRVAHRGRSLRQHIRSQASTGENVDLEKEVEEFLKRQAELESGAAFARTKTPDKILGQETVTDEAAKQYCREIVEALKSMKRTRDRSVNEVKLVVSIEDPRTRERRMLGIEDDRGVSRDEMASALLEVAEGRIPKDRLALKCLWDELVDWPLAMEKQQQQQQQAAASNTGDARSSAATYADLKAESSIARPYIMGTDARQGDKPQTLADMLPDWVGYTTLYGISLIPVFFVLAAVGVLVVNLLQL